MGSALISPGRPWLGRFPRGGQGKGEEGSGEDRKGVSWTCAQLGLVILVGTQMLVVITHQRSQPPIQHL